MTKAGPVYGSFATVAGMFALLYLVSQALVYAAEVAAVRYARLWPRALDLNRPTAADVRALALLAREQERIPAARVDVRLVSPDPPPPTAIRRNRTVRSGPPTPASRTTPAGAKDYYMPRASPSSLPDTVGGPIHGDRPTPLPSQSSSRSSASVAWRA